MWSSSDRQTKADLTASTYDYITKTLGKRKDVRFYEMNDRGEFVPFGSPRSYYRSRLDVYMLYGDVMYAIELKGRTFGSDRFDAAYFNDEKIAPIRNAIEKGYIPLWVETYTDGKARVWNMKDIDTRIGLENLPIEEVMIKDITIDPDSPKRLQKRRKLPYEYGTTITRQTGQYYEHQYGDYLS